jgi:hypothetical protein
VAKPVFLGAVFIFLKTKAHLCHARRCPRHYDETLHIALAQVRGVARVALRPLVEGEPGLTVDGTGDETNAEDTPPGAAPDVLIIDGALPVWSSEPASEEDGEGGRTLGTHVLAVSPDGSENGGENSVATTVEAGVAAYLSNRDGAAGHAGVGGLVGHLRHGDAAALLDVPQPQRSPLPGAAEHDPDGPHVCAQVVDEVAQALAHLLV